MCYAIAFGSGTSGTIQGGKAMEKQPITRKAYTSDLADAQWEMVAPMIPVWNVGWHRMTSMREVLNAIFYVLVNGC